MFSKRRVNIFCALTERLKLDIYAGLHSAVGGVSDCRTSSKFESQLGHISFMEIDHEIISSHSPPSLLLIQERQLSGTGESLCTSTG